MVSGYSGLWGLGFRGLGLGLGLRVQDALPRPCRGG